MTEPRGHLLGPGRPESSTALRCRVAWVLHTSESLFHVKGLALWASTGSSRRRVVVSIPYRLALCIDSGSSRRVVSAPGRPESWPRGCPRAPESLPPGSCSHGVVQLRHQTESQVVRVGRSESVDRAIPCPDSWVRAGPCPCRGSLWEFRPGGVGPLDWARAPRSEMYVRRAGSGLADSLWAGSLRYNRVR